MTPKPAQRVNAVESAGSPGVGAREEQGRDGCDCPEWVERCAHVDAARVWLVNARDIPAIAAARGVACTPNPKHQVFVGTWQNFFEGDTGSGLLPLAGWTREESQSYHVDYGAALAAFHAAELRLLGRTE